MTRVFLAFGLLTAALSGHAANMMLCEEYVAKMQAGAAIIKDNPNESCRTSNKGYPYWIDDPEKHWRFCDSPWVSSKQVKVELAKFKAFVRENCPCEQKPGPSLIDKLWGPEGGHLPG